MRPRLRWTAAVLAVALLALLAAVSAGWRVAAPPDLPVTAPRPAFEEDPRHHQTLAQGAFEAHGTAYAWEVRGFRELTAPGALHAFRILVHRTGGDGARVWPLEAVLHADLAEEARARYERPGEGAPPTVREGVLEAKVGATFLHLGERNVTATLALRAWRELPVGYAREADVTVEAAFPLRVTRPG